MKERPILFNGPMVRAALDGSKTQTRRIVKSKHLPFLEKIVGAFLDGKWNQRPLPYGQPGDRLWVREAFCAGSFYDACKPSEIDPGAGLRYRADGPSIGCRTRPSIHMPRWASRITLEVTGVRVERLQDITEAECRAEGCAGGHGSIPGYQYNATPSEHFQHIWQSTGGDWAANPWVWVIEFRRAA